MVKKRNVEGVVLKPLKKKVRKQEKVFWLDVLKKNGEESLFDQITDLVKVAKKDPPLFFGWEKIEAFLNAVNTAQGVVPAPPPTLILPPNMDVHALKVALLNYVRMPGAAAPRGTSVLPCTQAQCCQCTAMLKELELHPWTQNIIAQGGANILPIATIFIPKPRSDTVEYAMSAGPNTLWR
jgi:hypothetical protein